MNILITYVRTVLLPNIYQCMSVNKTLFVLTVFI